MLNKTIGIAFSAVVLAGAFGLAGTGAANAESVMKICGDQWKAAKAAGTTGGKTWPEFLSQCRAGSAAAPAPMAPAPTAAPAPAPMAPAPAPSTYVAPRPTTPMTPAATGGVGGEHSRIKQCGAMWKQAKANGTTNGLHWPQYWSQCNKQLKAQGQ
jgi:hypothetical protein